MIAEALTDAGWVSPVVPPASTTEQFYRGLAEAMGWPGYFGAISTPSGTPDRSQPADRGDLGALDRVRPGPARALGFDPGGVRGALPDRPAVCRRARLTPRSPEARTAASAIAIRPVRPSSLMSASSQRGQRPVVAVGDHRLDRLAGPRLGDHLLQLLDAGGVQGRVAQALHQQVPPGLTGVRVRVGDQHRALALAKVVAAGLTGQLGVPEDAEQVVAELEGSTQAASRTRRGRSTDDHHRRRGRRRSGRVAARCTAPPCTPRPGWRRPAPARCWAAARRWPGPSAATDGPGPRCPGTARRSPRSASPRRSAGRAPARVWSSPAVCSICADHMTSRSPSTMAPALPNAAESPSQPALACSASNWRCAAGRPRRRSEESITSSCTSALPCNTSRLAAAVSRVRCAAASGIPRAAT